MLPVEDQLAIAQLYAQQSHAIDSGDGLAWAACFTEDGTFRSPTYDGPVSGTEDLAAFAERFAAAAADEGVTRRHWTTSLVLDPAGEDAATGRCYAFVLATAAGDRPQIERSVVFHDRLVRRGGRWQIERREVQVDGQP